MTAPYVPDDSTPAPWTGQQWGVFYAHTALALGETCECADILTAVLNGLWDDYEGDS